jgi:hypothetical protein
LSNNIAQNVPREYVVFGMEARNPGLRPRPSLLPVRRAEVLPGRWKNGSEAQKDRKCSDLPVKWKESA